MIPFLKHNKEASASGPIDHKDMTRDEGDDYDMLESAAEDLCHAIEKKDYKAIAQALRAAFEMLDAEPHEEGEHIE